jgi:EmrB/QacA subfamily drug resistance transporter
MGTKQQGFGIVVLMCLGIFVCMLDTTIMNIALPAIQTDLHASLETMSWILNVYTMSIAVLSIPLARMAEVFGKAKFFILGSFLFGLGSALCGLANSGELLIASRFLQSIGASILMPVSMVIGVSAVPVNKRHLALGILGSTQGLAAAIGPAVGGIITQTLGWSWVFYVNVPVCLLSIVLGISKLPLLHEERIRVKIDWIGALLSSLSIFSLTLVLVKGNQWGWSSPNAWICYLGAMGALITFVIAEMKVKSPMVNFALFRNRQFTAATVAMTAATVYMVGVTVLLPQFLTHFQNKTELQAALLVAPVSATIFFTAPISGALARSIGNFVPVFFGFISLGLSYVFLKSLSVDATALHVIMIGVLLGAGFGLVIGPASSASASNFEGEMLTASQSVTQMFRQVGVVLSVAIFVAGLTHYISVQKQEVSHYATSKANHLDVPASVKMNVVRETKSQLLNSTWKENVSQRKSFSVSAAERKQLVTEHVNKALADLPKPMRSTALPDVTKQVTKQVDEEIRHIREEVSRFSIDIEGHATESMALSFSHLYGAGYPIVLGTSIVACLFLGRRKPRKFPLGVQAAFQTRSRSVRTDRNLDQAGQPM